MSHLRNYAVEVGHPDPEVVDEVASLHPWIGSLVGEMLQVRSFCGGVAALASQVAPPLDRPDMAEADAARLLVRHYRDLRRIGIHLTFFTDYRRREMIAIYMD